MSGTTARPALIDSVVEVEVPPCQAPHPIQLARRMAKELRQSARRNTTEETGKRGMILTQETSEKKVGKACAK
jgi:hypothetical protein